LTEEVGLKVTLAELEAVLAEVRSAERLRTLELVRDALSRNCEDLDDAVHGVTKLLQEERRAVGVVPGPPSTERH
jgi:hypothetical protein